MLRRGETIDEHRERMMVKADSLRRFPALWEAATIAQNKPAKRVPAVKRAPAVKTPVKKVGARPYRSDAVAADKERIRQNQRRQQKALEEGRTLRPAPIKEVPPNCVGCGRKIRPAKSPPVDGAAQHVSRGRCLTCYRKGVRSEREPADR